MCLFTNIARNKLPRLKWPGFSLFLRLSLNRNGIRIGNAGITLVELILVVSILGLLMVGSSSFGYSFLSRNGLKNNTNEIIASLRVAQLNAISSKGNSNWGVNVSSGKITLFIGDSFAARDTAVDEVFNVSPYVSVSDFELVFSKITGEPDSTIAVSVSNDVGDSNSISVNELGIVNVN